MIEALVGVLQGALLIGFARLIRGERWIYTLGLLALPTAYAIFAFSAGAGTAIFQEMAFGAPYLAAGLALSFVRMRSTTVLVGSLWLLHGAYDLVHGRLVANPGVPSWYPVYCCAVDVVVGVHLFWRRNNPCV